MTVSFCRSPAVPTQTVAETDMAGSLLCWTHPLVAMTDSYCPPDWTGQQHLSGLTLVRPMSNSSGTNNSALPALSRSGIQEHLAWRPSKPYIVGQVWQQQQMPDSTTRMNIGPMSGAIADSDAVVFPECGGGASSCISVDELAAQLQRKADIRSSSSSYDCLLSIGDSALDCDRSASCQRLLTPVTVEEADGINVWLSQQVCVLGSTVFAELPSRCPTMS